MWKWYLLLRWKECSTPLDSLDMVLSVYHYWHLWKYFKLGRLVKYQRCHLIAMTNHFATMKNYSVANWSTFWTGEWMHQFTRVGMYYYSSGLVDRRGQIEMLGTVVVSERYDEGGYLSLSIDGHKAVQDTSASASTESGGVEWEILYLWIYGHTYLGNSKRFPQ